MGLKNQTQTQVKCILRLWLTREDASCYAREREKQTLSLSHPLTHWVFFLFYSLFPFQPTFHTHSSTRKLTNSKSHTQAYTHFSSGRHLHGLHQGWYMPVNQVWHFGDAILTNGLSLHPSVASAYLTTHFFSLTVDYESTDSHTQTDTAVAVATQVSPTGHLPLFLPVPRFGCIFLFISSFCLAVLFSLD